MTTQTTGEPRADTTARGAALPYRVLITGSRTWTDGATVHAVLTAIRIDHPDMVLVSGACKHGADAIGERWAAIHGVPVERHPAEWRRYGRPAGFRRNVQMVQTRPDEVVAFIADGSAGATQCAQVAEKAGLPVRRYET